MSRRHHGQFTLELGEKSFTLRPTIECYDAIDKRFGGVMMAIDALRQASLGAATDVACAGIGTKSEGGRQHVRQGIFEAGVTSVSADLVTFLSVLASNPAGAPEEDQEVAGDPKE